MEQSKQQKQQKQAKDPQKEVEIALSELEERVERLRTLYEQYFMGFEKIEPGVARKEVDRRFALLRKAQIRNTALRFRFNVVTQKFNTYAMYWTRICRQIEEGTYKRHVARAARRFGNPNRPNRDDTVEVELDLEVELGDFEDVDMEALLAEVDAEAATYGRGATDTVPPGAPSSPPDEMPTPVPPRIPTAAELESLRSPISEERPASQGMRVARPAALPPGAKPRVLLRKTNPNGDRSGLEVPPSSTHGPVSTSSIRPSPHTPPTVVSPAAESSRNVLAAPRSPPSERHLPGTPTPATAFAPQPLPPPSERKLPVAPETRAGAIATPASPMSPRVPSPAAAPGPVPPIRPIGPKTPASPIRPTNPLGPMKTPAAPLRPGPPPPATATPPTTPHTPASTPRTPNAPIRPNPGVEPRPKGPPPLPSQLKKT